MDKGWKGVGGSPIPKTKNCHLPILGLSKIISPVSFTSRSDGIYLLIDYKGWKK